MRPADAAYLIGMLALAGAGLLSAGIDATLGWPLFVQWLGDGLSAAPPR
jgi:hypothetical protein